MNFFLHLYIWKSNSDIWDLRCILTCWVDIWSGTLVWWGLRGLARLNKIDTLIFLGASENNCVFDDVDFCSYVCHLYPDSCKMPQSKPLFFKPWCKNLSESCLSQHNRHIHSKKGMKVQGKQIVKFKQPTGLCKRKLIV